MALLFMLYLRGIMEEGFKMMIVYYLGSFLSDSLAVVGHEQSVYTVEPGKIQVRNFQVRYSTDFELISLKIFVQIFY